MNHKVGGLGRGLGALLPQQSPAARPPQQSMKDDPRSKELEVDIANQISVQEIDPNLIAVNPHQPRDVFSQDALDDLKSSIKEHGILQPLVVTKKTDGSFELIAGERRLRASKAVGLPKVPVIIRSEISEQKKLELALIENIQRQQLNAVEEAKAYEALADLFSLNQTEVAERVGKSRSYVANLMRLLDLEDDMLNALSEGRISKSHARTLLSEPDLAKRREMYQQMLEGKMTVREAEQEATGLAPKRTPQVPKDPNIAAIEQELRQALGTKVQITKRGQGGKLAITFYSTSDLKRIIEQLVEE